MAGESVEGCRERGSDSGESSGAGPRREGSMGGGIKGCMHEWVDAQLEGLGEWTYSGNGLSKPSSYTHTGLPVRCVITSTQRGRRW